jgi:nucleoside phosphorylase
MKILIVDDNRQRASSLTEHLVDPVGCVRVDINVAQDAVSARELLRRNAYDLMVLDIMLPFRLDDDPDEQTALSLLTELSETSNLVKPKHIIGLTAYEVAEKSAASEFANRSWVLVRENPLNDDWKQTIGNAVQYIRDNDAHGEPRANLVDVVVITALQLEMEAVRKLPWEWSPDEALDDSQFFSRGSFESRGRACSVVAAVATRMGMVSAAVLASKLIERFRPKLVVMPGICAGVRGKAQLGDVICSYMAWDYQSGKHVSTKNALNGFLMDPHFIQVDAFVSSRCDQLARDESHSLSVWRGWNPKHSAPPSLLRGPVASGSAVLADGAVTESIRLQQRKLLGVEMEVYGVFFAAEQAPRPKPLVMGLKAVCDYADDEKNDEAQPYAAYTSAMYLKEFCERFVAEL